MKFNTKKESMKNLTKDVEWLQHNLKKEEKKSIVDLNKLEDKFELRFKKLEKAVLPEQGNRTKIDFTRQGKTVKINKIYNAMTESGIYSYLTECGINNELFDLAKNEYFKDTHYYWYEEDPNDYFVYCSRELKNCLKIFEKRYKEIIELKEGQIISSEDFTKYVQMMDYAGNKLNRIGIEYSEASREKTCTNIIEIGQRLKAKDPILKCSN